MKKKYFLLYALLLSGIVCAQNKPNKVETDAFYYQSFDNMTLDKEKMMKETEDRRYLYQPVYSEGISGQALDLTERIPFRIPCMLDPKVCPSYDENSSFAIQVWVKTLKGARQGTPIMTNKKVANRDSVGWCIGTQDNGAWYWNISDGKGACNYEPTAERQAINDGEWHQIVVSVDRNKPEIWMYLDGRNVAIYRLDHLGSVVSQLRTVIGGSDEYAEPEGARGEWMAFNGKVDEVKIWSRPVTSAEVHAGYIKYKPSVQAAGITTPDRLKVQVWNIWHGGREYGQHVGVARTAQILKTENADIIGLIETYGSGAILADSLGYYFYLISSNLSIMSRYPITETVKIYQSFYSGGAILDLGNNQKLAFFDIWLWYADNERRHNEIKSILSEMKSFTENTDNMPVMMVGDFNTHSHLDVTGDEISKLPVTQEVINAGFKDSYRVFHPDPAVSPGATWSPLYNESVILKNRGTLDNLYSRIDYIFYQGKQLFLYNSEKLDHHPIFWPSDHASVVSYFYLTK